MSGQSFRDRSKRVPTAKCPRLPFCHQHPEISPIAILVGFGTLKRPSMITDAASFLRFDLPNPAIRPKEITGSDKGLFEFDQLA